jgi:hypothetical protein
LNQPNRMAMFTSAFLSVPGLCPYQCSLSVLHIRVHGNEHQYGPGHAALTRGKDMQHGHGHGHAAWTYGQAT